MGYTLNCIVDKHIKSNVSIINVVIILPVETRCIASQLLDASRRVSTNRVEYLRREASRLYESYRIFETRGIASLQIVSNI